MISRQSPICTWRLSTFGLATEPAGCLRALESELFALESRSFQITGESTNPDVQGRMESTGTRWSDGHRIPNSTPLEYPSALSPFLLDMSF